MPEISDSTCSAGELTSCSTSDTEAPGNGMNTLAKVTLICGSSSFGVTRIANRPSRMPTRASSGVISENRNFFASAPEKPSGGS